MFVWHPIQVHRPRDDRWAAWGVSALIIGLLLLTIVLLESCSGCQVYYRWDGSSGPDARPYYAVEVCKDKPPRVRCESATKLPNDDCK